MANNRKKSPAFPEQHQDHVPGIEKEMSPRPLCEGKWYQGAGKLKGKVALITGGDSGIGRAVSIFFAREGANVSIVYLNEHEDAEETRALVEEEGARCLLLSGDVSRSSFCDACVEQTIETFGHLNVLVNNAALQPYQPDLESLTNEKLERIFHVNVFSYFYMSRSALRHLHSGDAIINTTSVTAYRGSEHLLDYTSTKGAELAFTRALARILNKKGIRVNGVAPGPIWTPLTPSTYPASYMTQFGMQTGMGRAGHPEEVAPCYVFLAAQDSRYMSGQVLHPNGGDVINA